MITELEEEEDPVGIELDEVRVTKVVLGSTVTVDEPLPIWVEEDAGTVTETDEVDSEVEVTIAVELTPTVLVGVPEGTEVGG